MKIGLCQINATVGDFKGNADKILAAAQKAKDMGADLAVFPELALCGYPPLDMLERKAFLETSRAYVGELAKKLPLPAVIGAIVPSAVKEGTGLANAALLLAEGKIAFVQEKRLLPTYDVFDESRYFTPAAKAGLFPFECGGKTIKLGITICEDAWNDEILWPKRRYEADPVKELASKGADIILNISASPYHFGKRRAREEMYIHAARRHKKPVVFVNLVGGNDGLIFDGASSVYDGAGKKVLECAHFEEDVQVFDSCLAHKSLPKTEEGYGDLLEALTLGFRDYFAKCGFTKAVLGLSGGIDSALAAVIACRALGAENVIGVSMPSMYSSPGSIEDAYGLAKNLGMPFHKVPITIAYVTLENELRSIFGSAEKDITEENIQARIRGLIVMALSNKYNAMAIATGNKSEMAVGYCTLYGDMNGGVAPLGDLFKTEVYGLSRYINRNGEIIPEASITKPPSAELKPDQTDQDTLPPYEVLDEILRRFIEEGSSSEEIIAAGFESAVVSDVIRRVWINEYKRRQAALTLKVSVKAFGSGRRFPIACRFEGL